MESTAAGDQAVKARSINDLDLLLLEWDRPEFAADPYPRFEAARAVHPWLAKVAGGYVVHDLRAIRELLGRDDLLRTSFDGIVDIMAARGSAWGRFAQEQMIALPEKDHAVLRGAFASRFTPRGANVLRPVMRAEMERLLAARVPQGPFDFEEFASYYPVAVMTRMIGAPVEEIPALRSAMETLGLAFSLDKRLVPALDEAMAQFEEFTERLIAERRANPRGPGEAQDLLDILLEAGNEKGVTPRQMVDLLIFLFVAGYDTSKNVLTYTVHQLLDYPEIYARCGEDLDYCHSVVEEALRIFTPASTFRAAKQDFCFRDVLIPAGTMLFFTLNVAGRVSAEIENPHRFDPDRVVDPALRHVGFSLGRHMCLGQYIARAQLQEGLHLVARTMRNPQPAGTPSWRPFPGNWGLKGLPIVCDTVECRSESLIGKG